MLQVGATGIEEEDNFQVKHEIIPILLACFLGYFNFLCIERYIFFKADSA
jgi:hypothetical protein